MVYYCSIVKIAIALFLFIQIVNASPLGLCICPTCGCSKDNFCNTMMMNPSSCTCMNYQNAQNSLNPNTPCSCCNGQNNDMTCQLNNIGYCGSKAFSYNTQIPPDVPPMSRSSYSYSIDTPSVPCPQTYKNFEYQLQVPAAAVAPQREPTFGSFDGIIDKTYTKCSACKPVH